MGCARLLPTLACTVPTKNVGWVGGREPSADWLSALSASVGGLELVVTVSSGMTVVSTSSDVVVLGGREPSADWLSALSASVGGLELVVTVSSGMTVVFTSSDIVVLGGREP